jgi:L-alanine-DL-glutamate epimerase-like enolase superfamily enzyme
MRAPYRSAQRITTTAHNVLVNVTLADGAVGYGESAPATYVTGETQASVLETVQSRIPALIGREPGAAAEWLGADLSVTPGARGALETALLDAAARTAGMPLFRFLAGGANSVTAMATDLSLPILPPEEAAQRAAAAAQEGFRVLKIKVGGGDLAEDEARVRAVAGAAPAAMLRLDGNQGFSAEEAVQLYVSLADLAPQIELFEQPTLAGDDAAMAYVQQKLPCPVFADESVHHPEDARRLIESGVCRGVVLKLAKSGMRETRRIAEAAHRAGGRCLFGCMMETRIGITAALQVAVALGQEVVPYLDLDGHLLVNDEGLVAGGVKRNGDVLSLEAEAAGLGVRVDGS